MARFERDLRLSGPEGEQYVSQLAAAKQGLEGLREEVAELAAETEDTVDAANAEDNLAILELAEAVLELVDVLHQRLQQLLHALLALEQVSDVHLHVGAQLDQGYFHNLAVRILAADIGGARSLKGARGGEVAVAVVGHV